MKKSIKMLCVVLAVIMVVSLIPITASADNALNNVLSGKQTVQSLSSHVVRCMLCSGVPATNTQITLSNRLTNNKLSYTTDAKYGIALIPKELIGAYNVSASCGGQHGINWATAPGLNWTVNLLPNVYCLRLYPVLKVELEFEEHNAYIIGYSDGSFKPGQTVTRGEAATMIFRIMSKEARDKFFTTQNSFSDVKEGMAHNNAISTLANAGLISGYENGTFGYGDTISRAQFAAMLGRLFDASYTGGDLFGDISGNYAGQYINLLGALGILKGDGDGNANPNCPLTRAAACAMINRLLGRMPSEESIASLSNASALKTFTDVNSSLPLYADIMEATNSHDCTWVTALPNISNSTEGGIAEAWTTIKPSTNWIITQN